MIEPASISHLFFSHDSFSVSNDAGASVYECVACEREREREREREGGGRRDR